MDDKFISVEFDDGDSGRIVLEDIRYLLSDYPLVGKILFYLVFNFNKFKQKFFFSNRI